MGVDVVAAFVCIGVIIALLWAILRRLDSCLERLARVYRLERLVSGLRADNASLRKWLEWLLAERTGGGKSKSEKEKD